MKITVLLASILLFVSGSLKANPIETCILYTQKPSVSVSYFSEQDSNTRAFAGGFGGIVGSSIARSAQARRNLEYELQVKRVLAKGRDNFIKRFVSKINTSLNINHSLFKARSLNVRSSAKFYNEKGKLTFSTPSDSACKLLVLVDENISVKSTYKDTQKLFTVLDFRLRFYNIRSKKLAFKKKHISKYDIGSNVSEFLEDEQLIGSIRQTALETLDARFYSSIRENNGFYRISRSLGVPSPYKDEIGIREKLSDLYSFFPHKTDGWAIKKRSNALFTTYPKKHSKGISVQSQVVTRYLTLYGASSAVSETTLEKIEKYILEELYFDWNITTFELEGMRIEGFNVLFFNDNASNKKSLVFYKNYGDYGLVHEVKLGANHKLFLNNYKKEVIDYIKKSTFRFEDKEGR